MEQIPTTESYLQKVIRIAKELEISIDKASITCDAFELAFSDLGSRQAIFGMIDQLDESAVRKGEPMGLIIRYTVELGRKASVWAVTLTRSRPAMSSTSRPRTKPVSF